MDAWVTQRKRIRQNDFVIIQLAAEAEVHFICIDISYVRHIPPQFSIQGVKLETGLLEIIFLVIFLVISLSLIFKKNLIFFIFNYATYIFIYVSILLYYISIIITYIKILLINADDDEIYQDRNINRLGLSATNEEFRRFDIFNSKVSKIYNIIFINQINKNYKTY